jgi:hypothetical protein
LRPHGPYWPHFLCSQSGSPCGQEQKRVRCLSFPQRYVALLQIFCYHVMSRVALNSSFFTSLIFQEAYLFFLVLNCILLYALMCCIYATLFGAVLYICPRLINLLRSSLSDHQGLAVRLIVATTVCILIFGIHCVNYARLVIAPPRRVYWWRSVYWWCQYGAFLSVIMWKFCFAPFSLGEILLPFIYRCIGALELIPAVTFLCIMHPRLNEGNRLQHAASPELPRMSHSGLGVTFQRVDSGIRSNERDHLLVARSGHIRRDTPPTISTLSKGGSASGYGAVSNMAATDSS